MTDLIVHNIPDEINKGLIKAFPNEQERRVVINKKLLAALSELANESKKRQFFGFLDNFEAFAEQEKTAVEMIREARAEEI